MSRSTPVGANNQFFSSSNVPDVKSYVGAAHKKIYVDAAHKLVKDLEKDYQKIVQMIEALMRSSRSTQGLIPYQRVFAEKLKAIQENIHKLEHSETLQASAMPHSHP